MNESQEYEIIRKRVNALMSGGPLGDGIGPGNTAKHIADEFGVNYEGHEIWRIWRQGKEWANPKDDIYPV